MSIASDASPNEPSAGVLLLDLDGTLIDSSELILASYRHTMREHLGEVPPDSEWLEGMGKTLRVQLRRFASSEEEAEAMVETYREHNHRVHDRLVRTFGEVSETLDGLHRRGVPMGIVTSKARRGVEMGMEACGLDPGWFRTVVTADDVERPKPHPEPVLLALRNMESGAGGRPDPAATTFVGDSIHDLRAGRAAGVKTAAALWGPYGREELGPGEPDHWLESVRELEALVHP
ncbi:MAG: HAD hydrolase-like protein [Candidatus Palauibacterales bacterium]|nr:HAD hydrolase-like protein [Candidatus Palauibacterales bacterium]